ncbi:MAG: hypothetical protein GF346_03955 [Candidatus Eisenbacteria bacterium]|nr:hypothetical protein [Candidatus Latescibacterota bacterium]MBD3301579.1 hypothetical protein [Candidatus Eisenbacteria bacterium]
MIGERMTRGSMVTLLVLVVLASLAGALLAASSGSVVPLLIPAAVLAVPVLGRRVLSDPVWVLCLFLLVVVNLDFFKVGATGLTLDVLLSSALLWALLVRGLLGDQPVRLDAVQKLFLFFLAVTFLSCLIGVAPVQSIKRWGRDLQYAVFLIFLLSVPLGPRKTKWIVGAVIASSLIPCLLGLAALFVDLPALYGQPTPVGGGREVDRLTVTLSHPVTLALYLGVTATLTLGCLLDGRWFRRIWLCPVLALQLLILFRTYGRTGWAAFLVALVALLWLRGHRRMLLAGLPAALVWLYFAVPSFTGRWSMALEGGQENSMLWRLGLWNHALGLFPDRPLFGSGPGTFIDYVAYGKGFSAHQTWVGLLIETGVLGTVAFLVLQIAVGRALWRRHREEGPRGSPLPGVMLAVWWGFFAASFTAYVYSLPAVMVYFWTMVALALRRPAGTGAAGEPG